MLGYVTLGAADFERSLGFFDAVLGILGSERCFFEPDSGWAAWGTYTGTRLYICKPFDGQPATVGNGVMVSLAAASRAQVDQVHAAALAHGGADEGGPGFREAYGPTFYVAYFRDPTGNKLGVFHDSGV